MSYHDSMSNYIQQRMRDPQWAAIYCDAYCKLLDNYYPQPYVDMIMQPYIRRMDVFDAAFFSQVHADICMGRIVYAKIGPIPVPERDKAKEENNTALSFLPSPFSGYFEGGPGGCDGWLYWDTKIKLDTTVGSDEFIFVSSGPGNAPLEVGYTLPTTTIFHLGQSHWLARWPYGSEYVYLLHRIGSDLWNKGPL